MGCLDECDFPDYESYAAECYRLGAWYDGNKGIGFTSHSDNYRYVGLCSALSATWFANQAPIDAEYDNNEPPRPWNRFNSIPLSDEQNSILREAGCNAQFSDHYRGRDSGDVYLNNWLVIIMLESMACYFDDLPDNVNSNA
jgi:hypothetical protein